MSWIKNIVLFFVTIALITIFSNGLVGAYLLNYHSSIPDTLNENEVKFYRKYENQVNHLRDPSLRSKAVHLNQTSDLLFSSLSQQDATHSILITGDSWGEKFATDVDSYQALNNFSKSEHINFTLSGISSYSPTLLGVQSNILKRDFDLSFDAAFIVVDNTDIGDELCRYRSVVEVAQNGDKIVKKFGASDKMSAYFTETMLYINEVLTSDEYALKKLLLLALKKLETFEYQHKNCGWTEISQYLYEIKEEDARYFEGSVEYMIKEIKRNSPGIKIHILTVPHRKHISEEYKINTSILIDKYLNKKDFKKSGAS
ncbi:hypothetical protein OAL91_01970 [bacterium]|nr:hypothetical protein [bacterium]